MSEHSPLPWALGWDYQQLQLKDAEGVVLTEWTYPIPTYEPRYAETKAECDTADAEFIVRACNAHDELVACVDWLRAHLGVHHKCIHTFPNTSGSGIPAWIDSALQKARGES